MAKNQFASGIEEYNKTLKKLEIGKIHIQSDCPHHPKKSTNPRVITIGGKSTSTPASKKCVRVKCLECQKIIDMQRFDDNELDMHINAVDVMLDVIKMKCDLTNEKDEKAYRTAADMQFTLRTYLKTAFKAATKGNNKDKRSDGGGNITMNKPITR